jgi:hypothetical protein
MSYSFTRGLEFCIHESLVFGKATKSDFFLLGSYGNGISDYGNYGLESYVCCKHISQLSPTYYSTITLTVTGRQYLLTYSTEQSTDVSQ